MPRETEPQAATNTAHKPARFLVEAEGQRIDVHCPACLARSAGWWADGKPHYSGGWLSLRDHRGDVLVWACPCWVGTERARAGRVAGLRQLDIADPLPGWDNPEPFGVILWDRERRRSCPYPLPKLGELLPPKLVDILGTGLQGDYWPDRPSRLAAAPARGAAA